MRAAMPARIKLSIHFNSFSSPSNFSPSSFKSDFVARSAILVSWDSLKASERASAWSSPKPAAFSRFTNLSVSKVILTIVCSWNSIYIHDVEESTVFIVGTVIQPLQDRELGIWCQILHSE